MNRVNGTPVLPVISLAQLIARKPEAVAQLHDACVHDGFFYLVEHDLSAELIKRYLSAAQAFFALPESVKQRFGHHRQLGYPRTARGYVAAYGETLHPDAGPDNKQHLDWGIDRCGGAPFSGPSVLPDKHVAPDLNASAYALQDEVMEHLFPNLRRAIATALALPPHAFDAHFRRPTLIQRASYYPANSGTAGKHTDNGFLTVLIQQPLPQPSLRVHTRGEWRDVPCLEGAVLVNLGDLLQRWTNGRLVSTAHQVLHRQPDARVSLAFFIYPDIDAIISPIGGGPSFSTAEVMLDNFDSIWVRKQGAGRARQLV
ncbi:isopenicillin N synthase family dioxygenase [Pseudomonas coleopterorum]|uniref:isopenicillin N synthase family dioxygenase n=1 Tax=Pseudomonas coleopterorum TaxID=1605838 RepID=UPI001781C802|nr:isopenicillin N synthase family oxygenase [Pseudomonas coleopterorum]MBD8483523.1 isopenicillin N synthase family oxygenase [Pseudomonas coleopterorum]